MMLLLDLADHPSVNDPKFDQKTFLRFRSHCIALTTNIEMVISIVERDRNVLWFLWVNDIS